MKDTQKIQTLSNKCNKYKSKNHDLSRNLQWLQCELSNHKRSKLKFDEKYVFLKDSKALNIKENNIFMDHPSNQYKIADVQDVEYFREYVISEDNPFDGRIDFTLNDDLLMIGYLRILCGTLRYVLPQKLIRLMHLFYFEEKEENVSVEHDKEDTKYENDEATKNEVEDDWETALESIGIVSDKKQPITQYDEKHNGSGGCKSAWKYGNKHSMASCGVVCTHSIA